MVSLPTVLEDAIETCCQDDARFPSFSEDLKLQIFAFCPNFRSCIVGDEIVPILLDTRHESLSQFGLFTALARVDPRVSSSSSTKGCQGTAGRTWSFSSPAKGHKALHTCPRLLQWSCAENTHGLVPDVTLAVFHGGTRASSANQQKRAQS